MPRNVFNRLHSSKNQEKLETIKDAIVAMLKTAEMLLDGFPIPGAKGSIGAVLFIVGDLEKSSDNKELLEELKDYVNLINERVLQPVKDMAGEDVPQALRTAVDDFSKELKKMFERSSERSEYGWFRRFIHASRTEGELKRLSEKLQRAMEMYQTGALSRVETTQLRVLTDAQRREQREVIAAIPHATTAMLEHQDDHDGSSALCLNGTRVAILDEIKSWITTPTSPRLYWLKGHAGTGKSTVARTIGQFASEKGYLRCSFFFSRLIGGERQDPRLVFSTLAYQLAKNNQDLCNHIAAILRDDNDIGHSTIAVQFRRLIAEPLRATSGSCGTILRTPIVLILDALDECQGIAEGSQILGHLLTLKDVTASQLRVLITSRPEPHIRERLSGSQDIRDCDLYGAADVQDDITLYLSRQLGLVRERLPSSVPEGWPTVGDVAQLVEKSREPFIFAATAVRFIQNEKARNPKKRLDILLGVQNATGTNPYAQLDILYLQVLREALSVDQQDGLDDEDFQRFRWVMGCIVRMQDVVPLSSLCEFTRYNLDDLKTTLHYLHSILIFPNTSASVPHVRILHPLFSDFHNGPKTM